MKALSFTVLCHFLSRSSGFIHPTAKCKAIEKVAFVTSLPPRRRESSSSRTSSNTLRSSSASSDNEAAAASTASTATAPSTAVEHRRNAAYVDSLLENLTTLLDKWILTGSAATKQGAYNILEQIQSHARDPEQVVLARRRVQRAGLSLLQPTSDSRKHELGSTDAKRRRQEVEKRKEWEASRATELGDSNMNVPRTALGRRGATEKPNLLPGESTDPGLLPQQRFSEDEMALRNQLNSGQDETAPFNFLRSELAQTASNKVSEIIARAGGDSAFEGPSLGIGGLDDVLAQVKRRVWTPLAAPPQLLNELGITPVRGLLLYGRPGCGKTLLARKLGQILSPLRYVCYVLCFSVSFVARSCSKP